MKLTKKEEKEVLQEYNTYWDGYITGDVETMIPLLDDDYNQIGSAETEVFFNKKDAVKFLYETIDQVAGKAEMRNRIIKVEPLDEYILINDLFDIYVLIETEWTFYSKFRASTLLQKKEEGWKFIHQHSSMPDTRTQEGENIAIEKISKENLQLREAVNRRTIELEHKNRELEIEASLERVRAVAMGMNKSEDLLSICEVSYKEFQKLGFDNLRNTIIHILNDEKGFFLDYDYSDYLGGSINSISNNSHPIVENYLKQIKKAHDAFAEVVIEGDELDGWKEFRRKGGQLDDPRLDEISSLHYYLYSIGVGDIGISTLRPIDESQINILKRFRNVFDLAYRTYTDITKAEAQAREAQIELGLERVRTRAMAMQNSNELSELVDTVFKELTKLDFALSWCIINIIDESSLSNMLWAANPNIHEAPDSYHMKFEDYPFHDAMMKGYKERETKYIYVLEGIEKKVYDEYLFKETEFRKVPEEAQAASRAMEKYVCSFTFSNFGGLQTVGEEPLTDANLDILARFGKVFDLTYTRFNDLKQAEEQAREAQIETALEKVRSHTMGMRSSEELANVASVMFDQLRMLGGDLFSCGIVLCDKNKNEVEQWHSLPEAGMLPPFFVPVNLDFIHQYRYDQWKAGTELFSIEIPEDYITHHFELMMTIPSVKAMMDGIAAKGLTLPTWPTWEIDYGASFRYGYLLISALKPFEEEKILPRFAKVFEQTYTRFLDLQKAEAQTREAQIEAALERVRSRSMAMHSSDELVDASDVMFNEMKKLKIETIRIGIGIIDSIKNSVEVWSRSEIKGRVENKILGVVPPGVHPIFDNLVKAWKENKHYFSSERVGDEVRDYYEKLSTCLSYPQRFQFNKRETMTAFFFAEGSLNVISLEPLKEEECNIMVRFARVFGQMYRRFLDLKQAEEQAREAKIEAALERVRARTMSMYDSNELLEAVAVFFQQFKSLGLLPSEARTYFCHINTDTHTAKVWMTHTDGKVMQGNHITPLNKSPSMVKFYEAWKRKEPLSIRNYSGEALDAYMKFLSTLPHVSKDEGYQHLLKAPPERIVMTDANFLHGNIGVMTFEQLSQEALDTLVRFAKVFELTYTRFLDLQKAEAQAREAQIEAALERVRSRTMGMQKSEELKEVIQVVYEQFVQLNIFIEHTGFIVDYKARDDMNIWLADQQGAPSQVTTPYFDSVYWNRFTEAKEKGMDFFAANLTFEEKNRHYQILFKYIPGLPEEAKEFYFSCPGLAISTVLLENVCLYIENFSRIPYSDEENKTLMRFGKVFQQTYTRFLDLQNAEEQNLIIQAENERKTQELEEARQLQLSMLPKELPKLPNLDIAVYMQTATEVGGDYYDFQVGLDGTLTTVIGDATGHGMKAGTVVTITKSLFNSMAMDESILSTFEKISQVIKGMKFQRLAMCLIMMKIRGNGLSMSSAAMPPALIYRKKNKLVEEIFLKGMPLGTMKKFPYKKIESHLHSGDTILLLSDGLPELANDRNEMYGYDRTKTEFHSVGEKEPEEIVDHLKNSASQWVNGKEPDDDVTFVVIKVK